VVERPRRLCTGGVTREDKTGGVRRARGATCRRVDGATRRGDGEASNDARQTGQVLLQLRQVAMHAEWKICLQASWVEGKDSRSSQQTAQAGGSAAVAQTWHGGRFVSAAGSDWTSAEADRRVHERSLCQTRPLTTTKTDARACDDERGAD
jgi:hypothetical protein